MPNSTPAVLVVFCTCSSMEEARRISWNLVEGRLAACVNILPGVESVYRWQGAIETANEVLLVIKTAAERFAELKTALVGWHSYDVPEVIALPVVDGTEAYLNWVLGQV